MVRIKANDVIRLTPPMQMKKMSCEVAERMVNAKMTELTILPQRKSE